MIHLLKGTESHCSRDQMSYTISHKGPLDTTNKQINKQTNKQINTLNIDSYWTFQCLYLSVHTYTFTFPKLRSNTESHTHRIKCIVWYGTLREREIMDCREAVCVCVCVCVCV